MPTQLSGVLVALSTPFDADGRIDEAKLRDHVDFQLEQGVHGVVPGGSTGEFAAMTLDERKRVTEIVTDQVNGAVPVVPGTGACATRDAVELTAHAKDAGATAALVVAPYYETPTREEVIEYYGAVGDVGLTIAAYNLPEVTGINLDGAFYRDLRQRTGSVTHAKDTSGNMEQAIDLLQNYSDTVTVMIGLDTILLPGFLMGIQGTIWGAPNFAPRECVEIWQAVQDGRYDDAKDVFRRIWPVMDFICRHGYAVSTKAAAAAAGIDAGLPRAPYSTLKDDQAKELQRLVAESGISYSRSYSH